MTARVFFTVG